MNLKHLASALALASVMCMASAALARTGHSSIKHSGGSSQAAKGSSQAHGSKPKSGATEKSAAKPATANAGVQRDNHRHIKRSAETKSAFKHDHPCPSTGARSGPCPGYVIDHVRPLKRGGADDPSNMQWQTRTAAKQKDKTE